MRPIIRRIRRLASPEDARALTEALAGARVFRVLPDTDLARAGEPLLECRFLLDGFACRYKLLAEGKRQITAFLVPGDPCDLDAFVVGALDHAVAALSPATLVALPHAALAEVLESRPALVRALWRETLRDAAIAREWVANIGRRSAYQRVAHVLCEVFTRLRAIGLSHEDRGFDWPVTQSEFADATGLSTVHVNRMLQQLRGEELITLSGTTVRVENLDELSRVGEFDPSYLSIGAKTDTTPT